MKTEQTKNQDQSPLRGLATINLFAADHAAAVKWYTELLGMPPYYSSEAVGRGPGYAEFRIGDYQHELGILDARFVPGVAQDPSGARPAGVIAYWHVDDLNATLERLVALGARKLHDPVKQGEGFITAAVVDPFGNVLGIMYNQHYRDILAARRAAAGAGA
jgi:predicted enzyme related to lactoylglutathione lyase